MPVPGALQIFGKEFSNFEAVLLHNTPVLIDGSDFVDYFGPRDPLAVLWGGEYLSLLIQWRKILFSLRQCQLDPVFVFSADCELRVSNYAAIFIFEYFLWNFIIPVDGDGQSCLVLPYGAYFSVDLLFHVSAQEFKRTVQIRGRQY